MEFIPVNKQAAKEFEERLEKDVLARSTDNFIDIYNQKRVNKNNEDIDDIAKEIVETYKNISLVNRRFFVTSREEVIAEEFEVLFPHISFIATLKRIAEDILRENNPQDTLMVFTEDKKNIVHILENTSGELSVYEGAERLTGANKSISENPFLQAGVDMQPYGEDGQGISFRALDVMELDTSFITGIGDLLNKYTESSSEPDEDSNEDSNEYYNESHNEYN